jgi:hypothetical protein
MSLNIHQHVLEQLRLLAADRLLLAAKVLRSQLRDRINTPYPPASKPGEYPHRRSGTGYRELFIIPETPEGIVQNGMDVWIGWSNLAWYMPFLELKRDRKGIFSLLEELRPRLAEIIGRERI